MKLLSATFSILLLFTLCGSASAQPAHYTMENGHSHNDYEHVFPFYDAYARHFGSIEADLWAVRDILFVAHNRNQITSNRTFQKLYLDPLISHLRANKGKPYKNG
jgi:alkaline phosphatase